MKCTNCGQEVPAAAKVCGYCGHRLTGTMQPAPISTTRPKTPGWVWALLAGLVTLVGALIIVVFAINGSLQSTPVSNPNITIPQQTNPTATESSLEIKPAATATQRNENRATSIVIEPLNDDEGTKLSKLAQETGPETWTANISSNTPIQINWGWCTATREILEQNLSHMQILFYADDIDVTSYMAQSTETIEGGVCRYYRGIIRSWPVGQHTILYKMIFLQKVNDGEKDYEGETIKTYIVNVTP